MTIGEQLLNLTNEYRDAVENRSGDWSVDGTPCGREPSEIAAEYETALKSLLSD